MSQFLDVSALTPVLKEYYGPANDMVRDLTFKKRPLWAMLEKSSDGSAGGKYVPVPIQTGASQGRSSDFTKAQANQTANSLQEFLVTYKTDYSLASITGQAIRASNSDIKAFIKGTEIFFRGAFNSITQSIGSAIYRSGTGTIGTVGSISSGVITLTNSNDAVQFEQGMTLQAASTDGGTPRAAYGYVIAVDYQAGTVTVSSSSISGSAGSPSAWAANDVLLVDGDSNAKVSGLQAWLPTTAPSSSDNFYGVNRSVNPSRLAGVRFPGTNLPIEEALSDAAQQVTNMGGDVKYCFTNFGSYSALLKALGSKKEFVNVESNAGISFKGVVVYGASSDIVVLPDRDCPANTAFMLQMDTWKLVSLGECPGILTYLDSNQALRVGNSDAAECRVGYYANLTCNAPGWNAVITLAA